MKTLDYKTAHENGFYHEWIKDTDQSVLEKIDKIFGGWPDGFTHLKFFHGTGDKSRVMEFFNDSFNNGWWTVVMSKEKYLSMKKVVQIKVQNLNYN